MLCVSLLYEYGGYWLDAICFLSSSIPPYIETSGFFMFSSTLLPEWASPIMGSSWFIYSCKRNPLLGKIRNFLFSYYLHKKYLINYYLFHIVLAVFVTTDEGCKDIWVSKPYICNMNPHILQYSFSEPFSKERYNFIKRTMFCT